MLRVVDGDTIHARLDLGCDVRLDVTLRLAHIDAPEHGTPEGEAATAYLAGLLGDRTVTVTTIKDRREKFGRYLGVVTRDDDVTTEGSSRTVNEAMVAAGHATAYEGGARGL